MAVSPKIASIIARAYDKMGEMGVQIIRNFDDGYGLSEAQRELQIRLIKTTKLVRVLSKFVEFDDNGDYVQVHRLTDTTVNDILKYLIKVADLDNLPTAPKIFYRGAPAIRTEGRQGQEGPEGPTGPTGGGTDINVLNITSSGQVIDRFLLSEAKSAKWDYFVYGAGGRRSGTLRCTWADDGLTLSEVSDIGTDDIGTTIGNVSFTVTLDGSDIVLKLVKTSGTWNVRGTRYWIPGNGTYVPPVSGLLGDGEIYVGDINNNAVGVTPSGVLSMTNAGVFSYVAGSITNAAVSNSAAIAYSKLNLTGGVVNADISAVAAIAYSKLNLTGGIVNADVSAGAAIARTKIASGTANRTIINDGSGVLSERAITANRAIVSDGSGLPTQSATTDTEIGYVSGVTSPLQTQINTKQNTITGAATTVTSSNLTPDRLLVSDPSGKIAVSAAGSGAGAPGGSNNEMQKGVSGVFSGTEIFSSVDGNLILGSAASAGSRAIQAVSSSGNTNITLSSEGNGSVILDTSGVTISKSGFTRTIFINPDSTLISYINSARTGLTAKSSLRVVAAGGFTSGTANIAAGDDLYLLGGDGAAASNGNAGNVIIRPGTLTGSGTRGYVEVDGLITKFVNIGDWDMDADDTKAVAHGVSDHRKIRTVEVMVRDDSDNGPYNLALGFSPSSMTPNGGVTSVDATNINLQRLISGVFDSASFNSTGFNRGWLTIRYEP